MSNDKTKGRYQTPTETVEEANARANPPVETHVIEFSINSSVATIKMICERWNLTVDPNYSMTNGGVTRGLRVTGLRPTLQRLARRLGYPGQNPDLE